MCLICFKYNKFDWNICYKINIIHQFYNNIYLYDRGREISELWSYKVTCVNFLDRWWSNSDQCIDAVCLFLRIAGVGWSEIVLLSGCTFACGVCLPGENDHFSVSGNSILNTRLNVCVRKALVDLILITVVGAFGHITRSVTSKEMLNVGNRSHFIKL